MKVSDVSRIRKTQDRIAERISLGVSASVISLMFLIGGGLLARAWPVLAAGGVGRVICGGLWRPSAGHFGLASFVLGTVWVTAIAMVIAVPLGICTAIFLSEYTPRRVRECVRPVIDVLAGISPVIYGFWGVIAIVPVIRDTLMPCLSGRFPFFPFRSDNYTGFSALAGGAVLAVMIIPIIVAVVEEVLRNVPFGMREAALALGATKWEMVRTVVLKRARPGIVAAVILGLSRAFGETIAVLMVSGCALGVTPRSLFDPAYPLPALIANTYGEMMSIPLYDAAVLTAALILLLVTVVFNMAGWAMLFRTETEGQ